MADNDIDKLIAELGYDPDEIVREAVQQYGNPPTTVRTEAPVDVRARLQAEDQEEAAKQLVAEGREDELDDVQRHRLGLLQGVDPSADFVTKDVGTEVSDETLGVFYDNDLTDEELATQVDYDAANELVRILVSDEGIAETVDLYGKEEGGWVHYVNKRLADLARKRGVSPDDNAAWEKFVGDPVNRMRALKEIALYKTVGLWTAPVLVSSDFLLAGQAPDAGSPLAQLAAAVVKPTMEVIGVGGTDRRGQVIVRQASNMRHVFDMADAVQSSGSGLLRYVKDAPAEDVASLALPGVAMYRLHNDPEFQQRLLGSLQSRDNPFAVALDTETFREGGLPTKLGVGGAALAASVLLPDAFSMLEIARVGREVTDARTAKRFIEGFGEIEKGATDLARVDSVEKALKRAMPQQMDEYDRLKESASLELYQQSGEPGKRVASRGAEAEEVTRLLPKGNVKDGDTFLADMADRMPHLAPAERRRRSMSGGKARETVLGTRPEFYSLANRRSEFDKLKALNDGGADYLLVPQLLGDVKSEWGAVLETLIDVDKPLARRLEGSSQRMGLVFEDPAAFKTQLMDAARGKLTPADLVKFETKVDDFIQVSGDWLTGAGPAARRKLDDAITSAQKAIDLEHEARVITATLFRQHVAKKFDIDAPILNPALLEKAKSLPDLSADARRFRELLVAQGVDLDTANRSAALGDLMARRYSQRTGRDVSRWWESRVKGAREGEDIEAPRPRPRPSPAPAPAPSPAPAPAPSPAPAPAPSPAAPSPAPTQRPAPAPAPAPAPPRAPGADPGEAASDAVPGAATARAPDTSPQPNIRLYDSPDPDLNRRAPLSEAEKLADISDVAHQGGPFGEVVANLDYIAKAQDPSLLNSLKPWNDMPANYAAGVVVVDDYGRVLLREPANHFDGYHWTFAKGKNDPGEPPMKTALRELEEETGFAPGDIEIIGYLPDGYKSSPGGAPSYFFVARAKTPSGSAAYHWETQNVKFYPLDDARGAIEQGTNSGGVLRDGNILHAVHDLLNEMSGVGGVDAAWLKYSHASAMPSTTATFREMVTAASEGLSPRYVDGALLEKVGPKPGGASSEGFAAVYEGKKYLVKYGASLATDPHAYVLNEAYMGNLWAVVGAAPPALVAKMPDGRLAVMTEWVEGATELPFSEVKNKVTRLERIEALTLAVITGHRDIRPDNVLYSGHTTMFIDFGGSGPFRSQGLKKPFTAEIDDLHTLRNPSVNSSAAKLFGDLQDDELAEAIWSDDLADMFDFVADYVRDSSAVGYDATSAQVVKERIALLKQWARDQMTSRLPEGASEPPPPMPASVAADPQPPSTTQHIFRDPTGVDVEAAGVTPLTDHKFSDESSSVLQDHRASIVSLAKTPLMSVQHTLDLARTDPDSLKAMPRASTLAKYMEAAASSAQARAILKKIIPILEINDAVVFAYSKSLKYNYNGPDAVAKVGGPQYIHQPHGVGGLVLDLDRLSEATIVHELLHAATANILTYARAAEQFKAAGQLDAYESLKAVVPHLDDVVATYAELGQVTVEIKKEALNQFKQLDGAVREYAKQHSIKLTDSNRAEVAAKVLNSMEFTDWTTARFLCRTKVTGTLAKPNVSELISYAMSSHMVQKFLDVFMPSFAIDALRGLGKKIASMLGLAPDSWSGLTEALRLSDKMLDHALLQVKGSTAAYAGADTPDELGHAAALWASQGTDSPYFQKWAAGLPLRTTDPATGLGAGDPGVYLLYHGGTLGDKFMASPKGFKQVEALSDSNRVFATDLLAMAKSYGGGKLLSDDSPAGAYGHLHMYARTEMPLLTHGGGAVWTKVPFDFSVKSLERNKEFMQTYRLFLQQGEAALTGKLAGSSSGKYVLKVLREAGVKVKDVGGELRIDAPTKTVDGEEFLNISTSTSTDTLGRFAQLTGFDSWIGRQVIDYSNSAYGDTRPHGTVFQFFRPENLKARNNSGLFKQDTEFFHQLRTSRGGAEAPHLEFLDDGRAVFAAFENASVEDVVTQLGVLGRREMAPEELDGLVTWLNSRGIAVGRKGADFTGDPQDIESAEQAIGEALGAYIAQGNLPADAHGLKKVFAGLRDDIVTLYRGVSNLGGDVPDEVRPIFDAAVADLADDVDAFPNMLRLLEKHLIGSKAPSDKKAPEFLDELVREAARLGTDLNRDDVMRAIDRAISGRRYDDTLFTTDKPVFPGIETKAPSSDGRIHYTLRDMQRLRSRWADEVIGAGDAPKGGTLDAATQRAFKRKRLTEQLFDEIRLEPQYEELKAAHKELTRKLGQEAADRIINNEMLFGAWGRDKFRILLRPTVRMMFGWDAYEDMANLPPWMAGSIMAGVRRVEQHVGDSIRLTTEVYANPAGPQRAAAKKQLYRYLSGDLASFARGGRPALSSGTDKYGDLAVEIQTHLAKGGGFLTDAQVTALQVFADRVRAKNVNGHVSSPTGQITQGFGATSYDAFIADTLALVFFNKSKSHQFMHDLAKAFLINETNVSAVESQQVMEAVLYHMGVTKRAGQPRPADSLGQVTAFLEEIEGARRQNVSAFGSHTNESAVARMAVLIGSHGGAARTRQLWADMGLYVPGKVVEAFGRWSRGLAIEPELIPEVERVAKQFGLNPNFFEDGVFDVNAYLPRVARERLTDALARGLVKDEGLTAILRSTDDDMGVMVNQYYRFLKIQMTRGAFAVKQRYFFMNTYDHFNQLATVVGVAPALQSTMRVIAQDFAVLPGMSVVMAFGRRYDRAFPEKVRKVLQRAGDAAAAVAGKLLSTSKWRIEVNDVLEGREGFVNLGGNVYSHREIREIATQEGIFASFDTSALKKSIQAAQAELTRGASQSVLDTMGEAIQWWRLHLDDTAEAWSERERLGAMITLMEMGVDPRNAARAAVEALYDYSGSMSKQDRHIIIGALMPFWAFQKNANMQFVNYLFSSAGAYRMGVLRRGQERFAEAATAALYASVSDPYGVDVESMPPDLRDQYFALIDIVENGYGDLSQLAPGQRKMLEATFGPLDQLDEDTRRQLTYGYGGRGKVPKSVVMGLRLMFRAGRVGRAGDYQDGEYREMTVPAAALAKDTAFMQRVSTYSVTAPDPAGRRTYMRDRAGVAMPMRADAAGRLYYKLLGQTRPGHPYLEAFMPESSIHAGMRHISAVLAGYVLLSDYAARGAVNVADNAASKFGVTDAKTVVLEDAESTMLPALRNIVAGVADPERSPLIAPVLATMGYAGGPPIRVSPLLANMVLDTFNVELLTIPGERDIFAAVERGDLTMEQAEELADSGEPIEFAEAVDADGRASALVAAFPDYQENLTPVLAQRIVDTADALEIDPAALADLIRFESGFKTTARNKHTRATGLIQFMPSTAKSLGTTVEALEAMSPVQQMNYVYRYLAPFKGKLRNRGDLYMAVFYPAAIGKGEDFDIATHRGNSVYRRHEAKLGPVEAAKKGKAAKDQFIRQNHGIITRGDYNRYVSSNPQAPVVKPDVVEQLVEVEQVPTPPALPLRRPEQGVQLTEDRYYLLPGPWQIAFQMSGLADINRMMLGELPVARTPLEQASTGQTGLVAPTNVAAMALWARTILGMQVSEVDRVQTARAEEPRRVEETVRPPR